MQPFTSVYYAETPAVLGRRGIYPPQREAYILQTANPQLQRQRYYVWLLLEYAVNTHLGKNLPQLQLTVDSHGKWHSPLIHFSLSHSDNAVAVALSDSPVGVDIQRPILDENKKTHILAPDEYPIFQKAEDKSAFLTELWTKKESLFKISNSARFNPKTNSVQGLSLDTRWVELAGKRYVLSTTSQITHLEKVQL